MEQDAHGIAEAAAQVMAAKRAKDVKVLNVSRVTLVTDFLVIGHGLSITQVRAIADGVEERLGELGWRPRHREGYANSRWILLDYGVAVVHVFHEAERAFYDLERLWGDGAPRAGKAGDDGDGEARPLAPASRTRRV
jgi:ribosome-associated protein